MAITTTPKVHRDGRYVDGEPVVSYAGRVLAVEHVTEGRNLSDTLDYSDWQAVRCTYAFVYEGRVAQPGTFDERAYRTRTEPEALPPERRFRRVDCSNLFCWRGSDHREAVTDADPAADPEMAEDLAAFAAGELLQAMARWAQRCERQRQERARAEKAERDRAVVGRQMRVKSGRKVPVGTEGTVAYVRDGRALLKDDARWQDRKADGAWVDVRHLEAR